MNFRKLASIFFASATVLVADVRTLTLTSDTLSEWSVIGAHKSNLIGEQGITLPAGAQISRSLFGHHPIAVLSSRPTFGDSPEQCPVLELGGTALVFVRQDRNGAVMLVQGEESPVLVASAIPLDVLGRPVEPLGIIVDHDNEKVKIVCGEKTVTVKAKSEAAIQEYVVLSAGTDAAWPISFLGVTTYRPDPVDSVVPRDVSSTTPESDEPGRSKTQDVKQSSVPLHDASDSESDGGSEKSKAAMPAVTHEARTLKIFTPSAIRVGRAAQARAAIAQTTQK